MVDESGETMKTGNLVRIAPKNGNIFLIEDLDRWFGKEGIRSPGDFNPGEIGTVLEVRKIPQSTLGIFIRDRSWARIFVNCKIGWCRTVQLKVIS